MYNNILYLDGGRIIKELIKDDKTDPVFYKFLPDFVNMYYTMSMIIRTLVF